MLRCGVIIFPTDKTIQPVELAEAVESRGLDSLYLPEHTHMPVDSKSPFMAGDIPDFYKRTHDPFVALAACAAVTERITLATGICLVTQRDPITLAKEIASLDVISNGRVLLGVGAGWNSAELAHHGVRFEDRWRVLKEKILAMKTIWTQEEPSFSGEFVNFDPMWSYPKPVQKGGPKIWIGANSKWVPDRIADYADGWMPIRGRPGGASVEMLREACAKRGRDFNELSLAMFMAPLEEKPIEEAVADGFSEMIFALPAEDRDTVLRKLDETAKFAAKVRELGS
ncbi:MAG: LLM class F420-dependent oxidoreductase [Gammaproteobacteria bacterium]